MVFAFLLLGAAVTLPISHEIKSVHPSNSPDTEPTKRLVVLNPDTILSRGDVTKQVKSLDTVFSDHALKRTKRQVIDGYHNCAIGNVWFWNQCVSLAK